MTVNLSVTHGTRNGSLKPPLKWAGGKRWLVPRLSGLWGQYGGECRFVEPFCGGLSVALGLRPSRALLNDVNVHAINFYRWLQRGLTINGVVLENDRQVYSSNRDRFNELIAQGEESSKEAASLFYYLNRTGYNGLCRFNSGGMFNVPCGSYKTIAYIRDFTPYREAFDGWVFEAKDFEDLKLQPDDFVYADPPYDVEFTKYSRTGFNWDDQVRLAHWLARHTGPVVASNQATDRIVELYRGLGFSLEIVKGPRRISCNGDRTPADEILATRGLAS